MTKSIILQSKIGGDSRAAGSTNYDHVGQGRIFFTAGLAKGQTTFRHAGTFSDIYYRILTNATTAASTITFNVNGVDGNMTLSIGNGATGEFVEGTPHTDTISAGNLVVVKMVVGTGGAILPVMYSLVFAPTTTTNTVTRFHGANDATSVASVTRFEPVGSSSAFLSATESDKQFSIQVAGTIKNFEAYADGIRATSSTFTSRKNTANGNLTFVVSGTAPIRFEDSSNSDTIAADDLIDTQSVTGTGSDTLSFWQYLDFISTNGDSVFYAANPATAAGTLGFLKNTTRYVPLSVMDVLLATESTAQMKTRVGSADGTVTFKQLRANVSANTVTGGVNCTVDFRKNAGSGNNTLSIGGGTTGTFTDVSHTDTITNTTDEINYRVVNPDNPAGAATLTLRYIAIVMNIVSAVTVGQTVFIEWEES